MEAYQENNNNYENRGRKFTTNGTGIIDPRSESRIQFTQIKLTDPVEKWSERKSKARKDRRQANIKEKREEKKSKAIEEQKIENPNNKQLAAMIKQITESFMEFEKATRKEIDNIIEIVKLKFKKSEEEQKHKITKMYEEVEKKIEMINKMITKTEDIIQTSAWNKNNINIKNSYIHNQRRYRWGIAIMKVEEEKYIRVPLIPRWKFNKNSRTWIKEYWVQSMEGASRYHDFYEENKACIIEGKENIIRALRLHNQIKNKNMKDYRERMIRKVYERTNEDKI